MYFRKYTCKFRKRLKVVAVPLDTKAELKEANSRNEGQFSSLHSRRMINLIENWLGDAVSSPLFNEQAFNMEELIVITKEGEDKVAENRET
jgi:hypothetical protein